MQAYQIHQANLETFRFLKRRGITTQDLEQHPQADDIVLLTAIKDSFYNQMNPSELAVWGAYWNTVYYKKKPLKQKAYTKFENIINNIVTRQQQRRDQLVRIQALRHPVTT